MSRDNRPPHRTFGRLNLESLEAREVPAAYWWDPVNLNANGLYSSTDPQNWVKGSGYPYVRYSQSEPAPGPSDDLYYLGGLSSANCTIPQPTDPAPAPYGMAFAGIHLLFGPINLGTGGPGTPGVPLPPPPPLEAYTGTVTTAGSFTVGTLEVDCGTIKQDDPVTMARVLFPSAGTLTVKTTLDWTGGTLNSNTTHGWIDLAPGASGVISPSYTNPGINQTVGLGSTIELLGPPVSPLPTPGTTTLDVLCGDYNVTNGAIFIVYNQCSLNLLPDPDDAPRGGGGGNQPQYKAGIKFVGDNTEKDKAGTIKVGLGGTATFTPESRSANSTDFAVYNAPKGYLQNDGGTVNISDRVKVTLGGQTATNFLTGEALPAVQASVFQSAGTLSLQAGSQIITTLGVVASGGLVVSPALPGVTTNPHPEASIEATDTAASTSAFVLGGGVTFSMPDPPYRTFRIKGAFAWLGTVKLGLSALDTAVHDTIAVEGYVRIAKQNPTTATPPKLQVFWDVTAYDADMANQVKAASWGVVTSNVATDGILGDDLVNPPELPNGTSVTMETQASTDKKTLYVRKTSDRVPKQ